MKVANLDSNKVVHRIVMGTYANLMVDNSELVHPVLRDTIVAASYFIIPIFGVHLHDIYPITSFLWEFIFRQPELEIPESNQGTGY